MSNEHESNGRERSGTAEQSTNAKSQSQKSYAERESQTRETRPSTRTLAEAVDVFFRFPTPRVLAGQLAVSALARGVRGNFRSGELRFPIGFAVAWPVIEWSLHKYVLHTRPREIFGFTIDPYFARRHRQHHEDPSDLPLIFLPTATVAGASALTFVLASRGKNGARGALTALAGASIVALVYEWTHFITHTDYRPKSDRLKKIWLNHRLHHYRNEHHWYSFVAPEVDDIFGTGGTANNVEQSDTTRDLGVRARNWGANGPD